MMNGRRRGKTASMFEAIEKSLKQQAIERGNEDMMKGLLRLPPVVLMPKMSNFRNDHVDALRYAYGFDAIKTGYEPVPTPIKPQMMRWISTLCAIAGLAESSATAKAKPGRPWEFSIEYSEEGGY